MVSESKTGVCKYCSSPYHRGWQCPQRPKKIKTKVKKTKTKRTDSRNIIIKKFDEVYSRYTRMSQVITSGHCNCFICGKRLTYENACIGHYISRRFVSTRFEPVNANVICYKCNMIDDKQPLILELYKKRIIEEYGEDEYNRIVQQKNQRISTSELEIMFEDYKNKLNCLQKQL